MQHDELTCARTLCAHTRAFVCARVSSARVSFIRPGLDETGVLSGGHVHDDVTKREEALGREVLGEEVGEVVVRVDEGHAERVIFDELADVEMATRDVLGALVWAEGGGADFVAESLEGDAVFGAFGQGDEFRFRAGEGHGLLLFGAVEDDGALPADDPSGGGMKAFPAGVGEGGWVGGCRGEA
eukprot:752457-Prymnesium_polylepis.2